MKKVFNTKIIVGSGLLIALEIIFQLIGNYVSLGPVSINLSLIPIAIGAILYGPVLGALLGFVNGLMVLLAPSTIAIFMPLNAWGTVIVCLTKTLIAGVIAGFIYKAFKNKHEIIGAIVASLAVPIFNSLLFMGYSFVFYYPFLESGASSFGSPMLYLVLGVIGWNFVFEISITALLSSSSIRVLQYIKKRHPQD